MPLLDIRNVSHSYALRAGEPVHALRGVSLTIDEGEYVSIVGANGSGKTTLALHMNGILRPSDGAVLVDGLDTRDSSVRKEIRRTVGVVFQSPDDQMVATVVEEDVAFGPENLGVPTDELEGLVTDALAKVGMEAERLRPPQQLSAGQKQRVAIAGVLAMKPRCIVLDEATSMLDPAGAANLLRIIEGLNAAGMTVVTVTHKMDEAARSGRVVVMHRGQLVMDGTPGEVFTHRELSRWSLRPPVATQLSERLRPHLQRLPEFLSDPISLARALAGVQNG